MGRKYWKLVQFVFEDRLSLLYPELRRRVFCKGGVGHLITTFESVHLNSVQLSPCMRMPVLSLMIYRSNSSWLSPGSAGRSQDSSYEKKRALETELMVCLMITGSFCWALGICGLVSVDGVSYIIPNSLSLALNLNSNCEHHSLCFPWLALIIYMICLASIMSNIFKSFLLETNFCILKTNKQKNSATSLHKIWSSRGFKELTFRSQLSRVLAVAERRLVSIADGLCSQWCVPAGKWLLLHFWVPLHIGGTMWFVPGNKMWEAMMHATSQPKKFLRIGYVSFTLCSLCDALLSHVLKAFVS